MVHILATCQAIFEVAVLGYDETLASLEMDMWECVPPPSVQSNSANLPKEGYGILCDLMAHLSLTNYI